MSRIYGTIHIDFDTDPGITEEQFKTFEKRVCKLMDDFEMMIYDTASQCGFEADSVHPIMLNDLELD